MQATLPIAIHRASALPQGIPCVVTLPTSWCGGRAQTKVHERNHFSSKYPFGAFPVQKGRPTPALQFECVSSPCDRSSLARCPGRLLTYSCGDTSYNAKHLQLAAASMQ